MKHTPGPWRLAEGSVVDQTNTVIPISGIAQPHGYVPEDDVSWANARLIAAAPELLEALKSLVYVHPVFRNKPMGSDGSIARREQEDQMRAEDEALAAIRKAEGVHPETAPVTVVETLAEANTK